MGIKRNAIASRKSDYLTMGAVVLSSIATKFSLTNSSLLPGLDGAYYWVQVRSLLENSALAFSDLPMVLWAQSFLALLIGDVPSAVRISDAVFPALSIIPVFLIVWRYQSRLLPVFGIAFVLLHPVQLYFFTGDFIKNESTIPVVIFLTWIYLSWDELSKKFRYLSSIISISIIALSHFGTLLLAVMISLFWIIAQILQNKSDFKRSWIWKTFGLITLILSFLAWLVPSRFETLTKFLLNPENMFQIPAWHAIVNGYANPVIATTIITSNIACLLLGILAFQVRNNFTVNERSLVSSALISTFILSSPLIGIEWFNRLAALSFVPLAVAGMIIFAKMETTFSKLLIGTAAAVTLFSNVILSSHGPTPPVLSEAKYLDFQEFIKDVDIPENSIVVARHGMQYLLAWHLEVDVASQEFFENSDLANYTSIYLLIEGSGGEVFDKSSDADGEKIADKAIPESKEFTPATKDGSVSSDEAIDLEKSKSVPTLDGVVALSSNGFSLVKIR